MSSVSRDAGTGSRWMGARPSPGAIFLLALEVGAFLLYVLLGSPPWVREHLALHPNRALGPEPWQLLTSGVLHVNAASVFFSAFSLWLFGTAVEQRIGRTRMLLVFAGAQLAGALLWALVGRLLAPHLEISGCDPGCLGLVAAFGAAYYAQPMSLFGVADMRSGTMALLFVGISAVQYLLHGDFIGLSGALAGAAAGWALASTHFGGHFDGRRFATSWERFRLWRLRRRYKVIPGGLDQRRYLH